MWPIYLTSGLLANNLTIGPLKPLLAGLINLLDTWIKRLLRVYAHKRFLRAYIYRNIP